MYCKDEGEAWELGKEKKVKLEPLSQPSTSGVFHVAMGTGKSVTLRNVCLSTAELFCNWTGQGWIATRTIFISIPSFLANQEPLLAAHSNLWENMSYRSLKPHLSHVYLYVRMLARVCLATVLGVEEVNIWNKPRMPRPLSRLAKFTCFLKAKTMDIKQSWEHQISQSLWQWASVKTDDSRCWSICWHQAMKLHKYFQRMMWDE